MTPTAAPMPADRPASRLSLPLVASLSGRPDGALARDVTAGLTVGVMLVPQGMAYALIAGLPPVFGLYAALAPLVAYALLGSSRQLAVGPVAMVSLLVATGVSPLAAGDPARYLALALALSALVGAIQLAMGALRGGFLVHLLSHPVLAGFTSAAAITIGVSQLPSLLGLELSRGPVHETVGASLASLGDANPITVAIAGLAIMVAALLRRRAPRLPAAMLLVVAGTIASALWSLEGRGVRIVGQVPSGLPVPMLPAVGVGDLGPLLPIALTIALIGFMESIAVAKVYASRNRYDLDADQELKALGVANLVGSVFQAFPVTGGFSRTAVNADAGAGSQLASLVAAAVIAVTLLFLTPLFHALPKAILGAIIVVAVAGLVDVAEARRLWRVDRRDFALMAATFVATLALGIEKGVLAGVALSVFVLVEQISRPHVATLGRIPGTSLFRDLARNPSALTTPGIEVLRFDASLFFGNAESLRVAVRDALARASEAGGTTFLVLDAYPMNRVDSTGLHTLVELIEEAHAGSARILVAGAKERVSDKLRTSGVLALLGPYGAHGDTSDAVSYARGIRDREAASESGEDEGVAWVGPQGALLVGAPAR